MSPLRRTPLRSSFWPWPAPSISGVDRRQQETGPLAVPDAGADDLPRVVDAGRLVRNQAEGRIDQSREVLHLAPLPDEGTLAAVADLRPAYDGAQIVVTGVPTVIATER